MALVLSSNAPPRTAPIPPAATGGPPQRDTAHDRPVATVRAGGATTVLADAIAIACALAATSAAPALTWTLGAGWLLALSSCGAYRCDDLGAGTREYRRVAAASVRVWGVVAALACVLDAAPARATATVTMPLGLVALLAGRLLARACRRRRLHRVVIVGADAASALRLAERVAPPDEGAGAAVDLVGVAGAQPPPFGSPDDLAGIVGTCTVDTVVVDGQYATADLVRRIAWSLEGSGVDLAVALPLDGIAGGRLSVRSVAGVPLLRVGLPRHTGFARRGKDLADRLVAAAGLVLLAPLLVAIAVAVRVSSPGPALFRQWRTGRDGRQFEILKFRTMHRDAEQRQAALAGCNDSDGLLFKIRDDPRLTRLGVLLRRTSLDELPQLVNVLRGEMSLVGPRPLPVPDADFQGDVRRRLLVRPGITGLWQVSGRSRLTWQDAVQLDLYYVENWSIGLDLQILRRTVGAVLRGTGAY